MGILQRNEKKTKVEKELLRILLKNSRYEIDLDCIEVDPIMDTDDAMVPTGFESTKLRIGADYPGRKAGSLCCGKHAYTDDDGIGVFAILELDDNNFLYQLKLNKSILEPGTRGHVFEDEDDGYGN